MRTILPVLAACVLAIFALPRAVPGADSKVKVCHLPLGNPENVQTIMVGENAVSAHLAHGDTVGACPTGVGCIPGEAIQGPSGAIACTGAGVGECIASGVLVCANDGQSAECDDGGPLPPGVEICNGLDDDCDGQVDAPLAAMCPVSTLNEPGVCLGVFGCSTHQGCDTFQDCAKINPGANCDPVTRLCTIKL